MCHLPLKHRHLSAQFGSLRGCNSQLLLLYITLLLQLADLLLQDSNQLLLLHQFQTQVTRYCWLAPADASTTLQQLQPHIRRGVAGLWVQEEAAVETDTQ